MACNQGVDGVDDATSKLVQILVESISFIVVLSVKKWNQPESTFSHTLWTWVLDNGSAAILYSYRPRQIVPKPYQYDSPGIRIAGGCVSTADEGRSSLLRGSQ